MKSSNCCFSLFLRTLLIKGFNAGNLKAQPFHRSHSSFQTFSIFERVQWKVLRICNFHFVCNNSRNFFSAHSNLHWKLPENNVNHFHNNNNDKQVFQNTVQLSQQSVYRKNKETSLQVRLQSTTARYIFRLVYGTNIKLASLGSARRGLGSLRFIYYINVQD